MRQTSMFLRMWGPVAQLAALLPGVLANVNDEVRILKMTLMFQSDYLKSLRYPTTVTFYSRSKISPLSSPN